MVSVFDAFVGQHFDPVFSNTAVASWAENAARLDVETFHAEARRAVREVVDAARTNQDPSQRIALIQGESGLGKTHAIIATLWQLSREGRVYPAIMQLAANVAPEDVWLWMLRSAVGQLGASHFRDKQGRSPLKRLADSLWVHVPEDRRQVYDKAVAENNEVEATTLATAAAERIRQALRERGVSREMEPIIAGLILAADDASYAFDNWLRGGTHEERLGRFTLPPLLREDDRVRALICIARLASATEVPFVVVLDQIEAVSRIGNHALLGKVIASAVQLVEGDIPGTGVIISALNDTFERLKSSSLDSGFVRRIEDGIAPVALTIPTAENVREVIHRRTEYLLERAAVNATDLAPQSLASEWLLRRVDGTMLPRVFQVIRKYRAACLNEGRFLTEPEYQNGSPPPPPAPQDFDKLWADEIDADTGAIININAHERTDLFRWLAANAAGEQPQIASIDVDDKILEGREPTQVFDLHFKDGSAATVERWKIAFADAPNAEHRLHNQIESFLNTAHDAKPALLRVGPFTRITDEGEPVQSITHVRGSQAGPQLANVLEAGGRLAPTKKKDWTRLRLARKFVEGRREAAGFNEWRAERRFLLDMAEIGVMTNLVQPEGRGNVILLNVGETRPAENEIPRTSTRAHDGGQSDRRDYADILIGHAIEDNSEVRWTLDKNTEPKLPNFGLLVSGDAGQGKTEIIKAVIADSVALGCPVLIFDFKNDYGNAFGPDLGFAVIDLNERLPFNPLKLPPHGPSGAQAINHIFEVAGLLGQTLKLGDQQKALLRSALEGSYTALGVPLNDWVDPERTPAPSLGDVIDKAEALDEQSAVRLINRLGLLHGKRLLPADGDARMNFADLMKAKAVLSFNNLPNDDQLKSALAELILIQLQGHMLRGAQPRALRHLLVFDEAWRAADSKRLIQLAREGRAFGVGVVAGSQFADDLSGELTGNLATKLHFYNSDAGQRRKIVQAILGTTATGTAGVLSDTLRGLKQFQAVFTNQQHVPYTTVNVAPYFKRLAHQTLNAEVPPFRRTAEG